MMILILLWLGGTPMSPSTTDQFGNVHHAAAPGEGLTVLDFAASWCKPCWKALPRVEALAQAEDDLRVLVISQDERERGRNRLVRELGLTLPVVWDEGHQWARHL